jgi:hypothetical protein
MGSKSVAKQGPHGCLHGGIGLFAKEPTLTKNITSKESVDLIVDPKMEERSKHMG